ncbi:MAG: thioredoxin-disulfide reductase [Candidatus Firestonebacteria bacterium]
MNLSYDVIIIGAGPAGLTSAIYLGRAKIKTLVMEKVTLGGKLLVIDNLENYPGFSDGINGFELASKLDSQSKKFGAEFIFEEVKSIKKENNLFKIVANKNEYISRAVVVASGSTYQHLNVDGEERLIGKGVSFCATCDGAFFKEQVIAVVGGGNSALEEALFLTRFAKEVYVIHRRDEFRAVKILQERIKDNPKTKTVLSSMVIKICGENKVESVIINNVKDNKVTELKMDGIFIAIGQTPNTDFCKNLLKLDEKGYIITNQYLESSISGIYAIGDVRNTELRQVATAVGDGAYVSAMIEKYLQNGGKS